MSWSIGFLGKADKVVEAMKKYSDSLSGMSKEEYDEALPHMTALVSQNFSDTGAALVRITANGHASKSGDQKTSSHLTCNVEVIYTTLV